MRCYPQEVSDFILANYIGISTAELVMRVNAEFGTAYTVSQLHAYKSKHKLKSGVKPGMPETYYSKVFPKEVCEYINANCCGVGPTEMTERLNTQFGTNYTVAQVNGFYSNHKVSSGLTGRFEKGHISHNKGRKGVCPDGCEKGWFKKGNMPQTYKPVGTESLRSDGYWWVKVADPNKWREKHVIVWEAAYGKRPPGHVITFLDGNRNNFAVGNLRLITQAEHAVMSHEGYRSKNPDITETGILLARIKIARTAAKERTTRRTIRPRSEL